MAIKILSLSFADFQFIAHKYNMSVDATLLSVPGFEGRYGKEHDLCQGEHSRQLAQI